MLGYLQKWLKHHKVRIQPPTITLTVIYLFMKYNFPREVMKYNFPREVIKYNFPREVIFHNFPREIMKSREIMKKKNN